MQGRNSTSKWKVAAAALGLLAAGAAAGAAPARGMSTYAYETGKTAIEQQYASDCKLCEKVRGHARDVCEAQARGKQQAAHASLQARYQPSPEARQEVKLVIARANYKVAREKCELLEGDAEDACLDRARAAREAAERQARVEKVEATGGIYQRDGD